MTEQTRSAPTDQPNPLWEDALPRSVRWWAAPLGVSVVLGFVLFPFDGPIFEAVRSLGERLGGDVKRELQFLGQFGAISSVVIAAVVIWLLDERRRSSAWRVLLAAAVSGASCLVLKMLIGRPRPKFDDPGVLLGPFGAYPIGPEVGVRHAWEFWADISSDLWAMPSSHTAGAFALAAVLTRWYPKLLGLLLALAITVAASRLLFGAHYPSDVAVGAGVGWISGLFAARWGVGKDPTRAGNPETTPQRDAPAAMV